MSRISPRERESVLRSLSWALFPLLVYTTSRLARLEVVNAMIQDLDQVERSGTFVRFIVVAMEVARRSSFTFSRMSRCSESSWCLRQTSRPIEGFMAQAEKGERSTQS